MSKASVRSFTIYSSIQEKISYVTVRVPLVTVLQSFHSFHSIYFWDKSHTFFFLWCSLGPIPTRVLLFSRIILAPRSPGGSNLLHPLDEILPSFPLQGIFISQIKIAFSESASPPHPSPSSWKVRGIVWLLSFLKQGYILYSPGSPGTPSVDHAGLKRRTLFSWLHLGNYLMNIYFLYKIMNKENMGLWVLLTLVSLST